MDTPAPGTPPSSPDPKATAFGIADTLTRAGHVALLAGGCVRDLIMGRPPVDYDIATDATPDQIMTLFPETHAVGKAFGVVLVVTGGHSFEVATFRRDLAYRDSRHPEGVVFSTPEEDAARRDFTINGLFLDPRTNEVIDYVGGRADIDRRLVRAIGNPQDRFAEDALRMLRAVRFASTLDFQLDTATAEAIRAMADRITNVSAERIQTELTRILTESPKAGRGLELLKATGLLRVILPEVERMDGVEQPSDFHPEGDVFRHTVMMLNAMVHPSPVLAWAVLLHDVGKPPTARHVVDAQGRGRIRFDGHDKVGAEIAGQILTRLRMPADFIEAVTYCVKNHMRFIEVQNMRKSTLRQLAGAPTFPVELELHRLDCLNSHGDLKSHAFLKEFLEALRNEPVLPAPWINGHDIMALGVPKGPDVGRWHKQAYEAQLEGRFPSREALLEWLRDKLAKVHGPS